MMDFGRKGLNDTLENIRKREMKCIGAGRNIDEATEYVILGTDVKIGIIAFQYKDHLIATGNESGTAHDKHKNRIKKQIQKLKKLVDWVVVVYHGGDEFINVPMPYTRRKLRRMLRWGANIVVAHHPHTVQGYEKIKDKMIFYSLGNFIFDTDYQRAQAGTEYGELLRIKFTKDNYSFENLNLYNDREKDKLVVGTPYEHFKEIKSGYHKMWKKEAKKFKTIKTNKKALAVYRKHYSVKELYIEKVECKNYMDFDKLVKKHSFDGMNILAYYKKGNQSPQTESYLGLKPGV